MPRAKKQKSTEVAIKQEEIVEKKPQAVWSQEQVQLIKNTVAKGATDDELKLFLYTASRTGLDPLTKQIHFVKRWDSKLNKEVGAIQTGIDGYRAIAERTGQLAGIDDAVYEGEDPTGHPIKATVTVYRIVKNIRVSFTASARWSEYAPRNVKQGFMWDKMPYLMLAKCAETLALRKAFPNNLSGIYTNEEMQQADAPIINTVQPIETPKVEEPKKDVPIKVKLLHLLNLLKIDTKPEKLEEAKQKVRAFTGLEFKEENYEEIVNRLEEIIKQQKESQQDTESVIE